MFEVMRERKRRVGWGVWGCGWDGWKGWGMWEKDWVWVFGVMGGKRVFEKWRRKRVKVGFLGFFGVFYYYSSLVGGFFDEVVLWVGGMGYWGGLVGWVGGVGWGSGLVGWVGGVGW